MLTELSMAAFAALQKFGSIVTQHRDRYITLAWMRVRAIESHEFVGPSYSAGHLHL